jgi:hypothetical protein
LQRVTRRETASSSTWRLSRRRCRAEGGTLAMRPIAGVPAANPPGAWLDHREHWSTVPGCACRSITQAALHIGPLKYHLLLSHFLLRPPSPCFLRSASSTAALPPSPPHSFGFHCFKVIDNAQPRPGPRGHGHSPVRPPG